MSEVREVTEEQFEEFFGYPPGQVGTEIYSDLEKTKNSTAYSLNIKVFEFEEGTNVRMYDEDDNPITREVEVRLKRKEANPQTPIELSAEITKDTVVEK